MRKNFGVKTWLYPMPVFIVAAYDENGNPNAMNAAWGGIYTDDMIGICLSEEHKTTQNILATRAFTVSMATADKVAECDYVGIVSGNKVPDKFTRAGFIIRKTKRFTFFERSAHFSKTKRTSVGYPPFQKFFDWLTPVLYN